MAQLFRSMQATKRSLIGYCVQAAVIASLACAVSCAHTSPTGSIGQKPTPFPEVIEKTVSWPEAVALIRGGSITRVSQTHALAVGLSGGGRRYFTREPEIDAVWHLLCEVDPKHERILFGTE
jgi:hypothetical protein